jgi:uncharacterized membrane-anchored protein YhcB (DUF1043 family)
MRAFAAARSHFAAEPSKPRPRARNAIDFARRSDCTTNMTGADFPSLQEIEMVWLAAMLTLLAIAGFALAVRLLKSNRRDVALRDLLDGADALEEQLHECRVRMKKLQGLLAQLPSDMTGSAMSSLDPEGQVRTALRDVLAHRLWIKQNGATASQKELDEAREAIRKSRDQLGQQLQKLDEVGQELAQAGATLKAAYSRSAPRVAPAGKQKNGRKLNGHAAPDA